MPSSSEYTDAASTYRSLSSVLGDDASAFARSIDDVHRAVGDGLVVGSIDRSLRTVANRLATAAAQLVDIAELCDRRAEVCRAYERAWSAHLGLPLHQRIATPPPVRPARWVG